jgi:hypothetical protein
VSKTVRQLSLELRNEPGQLAAISARLGEGGVNIIALFVTTTTPDGGGLMRFVADNPERAVSVLAAHGVTVAEQDVLAAETPHHAGGLQAILAPLEQAGVNVGYVYPCILRGASTILIVGIDGPVAAAAATLEKQWIRLYGPEIYDM